LDDIGVVVVVVHEQGNDGIIVVVAGPDDHIGFSKQWLLRVLL